MPVSSLPRQLKTSLARKRELRWIHKDDYYQPFVAALAKLTATPRSQPISRARHDRIGIPIGAGVQG